MIIKFKNWILMACIAALVTACIPDPLDVNNVPVLDPHLVISSQVVPGQGIAVLVTKSITALNAGSSTNADTLLKSIVVDDAFVTIVHEGRLDTLVYLGSGVYGSATISVVAGVTYKLTVASPSMGTATSTAVMNTAVRFDSLAVNLFESGKDTLLNVKYSLNDPPGKNWYMVDVQRIRTLQRLENNLNPRIFIKAFSDEKFDGTHYREEFSVPFRRFHVGDTVAIVLANISEEYYQYLKDGIDGQNSISALVSEPLNFPTNVQNGYGFFNLQIPDVRVFQLK